MSEKITLTIEGTAEEIARACLILGRGQQPEAKVSEPAVKSDKAWTPVSDKSWTPVEARRFLKSVRPEALLVLKEIAKKPAGYPRGDLLKALSLKGNQLAGTLSSVGHQMRRFPGKERPLILDRKAGVYRMPVEIASQTEQSAP